MTVRSQNVKMDTEMGGSWEGKRREGWEKGYEKRKTKKVSTYMDGMQPSFLQTLVCLPMSDIV